MILCDHKDTAPGIALMNPVVEGALREGTFFLSTTHITVIRVRKCLSCGASWTVG